MSDNTQLLAQITEFLNLEADMLDHKEYDQWLDLWTSSGIYIVPVDHTKKDYKNSLNVAYDDAEMRKMRVQRLLSGEAISTETGGATVRTMSRFRILDQIDGVIRVRCAYALFENNKNGIRTFPADVQFKLIRDNDSFKIEQKVIHVMKSAEHLTTVSYIF